jgi:putative transport protein
MNVFFETLRSQPELSVFLAVGIGYWVGNYKIGNFSLGTVTAALIAGLMIGYFGIEPSRDLRWAFFMLFLFANGYSVGPQFFQAMERDGFKPMLLALLVSVTGLFTAVSLAKLLHLDIGLAAGLFSGGMTQSAAIGTATDAIMGLSLSAEEKKLLVSHIAVADALCYIFGAIGIIWFCGSLGPWLLGIDLKTEAKILEAQLGITRTKSGLLGATQRFSVRCYQVGPKSVVIRAKIADLEYRKLGAAAFVYQILRRSRLIEAFSDTLVEKGDVLVLTGHTPAVISLGNRIGSEIVEPKATSFSVEILKVVITNKKFCERNVEQIRQMAELRNVEVRSLSRGGVEIPTGKFTGFNPGDVVELIGPQQAVERAAKLIGYSLRPTSATPLSIVGIGIFLGGLIGIPYFYIGDIKVTLTISVGVLLGGLFMGWLKTRRPILPYIPEAALQSLITLGLAVFVACVGIQAGPVFLDAVRNLGGSILLAGIGVTLIPVIVGLAFGKFVLRMNPVILLGAVAGAQTYTGGMAAVQEKSGSPVAVLGYTVPYATSNILLTFFGAIIVALMAA